MGNIETKNGIPLYEQVYSALCRDIDLGIYKSGEQIPAEGYLCEKFHVSRVTVRKALQKMVDKKILVKRHGIGTFVSSPFVESTLAQSNFCRTGKGSMLACRAAWSEGKCKGYLCKTSENG